MLISDNVGSFIYLCSTNDNVFFFDESQTKLTCDTNKYIMYLCQCQ
jgi:hypothetical protein